MFVRWQSRKRQQAQSGTTRPRPEDIRHSAILVEDVRVNGQSTQRHIAYLGSILKSTIEADIEGRERADFCRAAFWEQLASRLDSIKRLSTEDRRKIETAIAAKVPRASDEQLADVKRRRELQMNGSSFFCEPHSARDPQTHTDREEARAVSATGRLPRACRLICPLTRPKW